jgi:hypothetical protein
VHHRHLHAAQAQAVRGLQAQQAAADDHRVAIVGRGLEHAIDVVQVAEGHHAGELLAGSGSMMGSEPVAISSRS